MNRSATLSPSPHEIYIFGTTAAPLGRRLVERIAAHFPDPDIRTVALGAITLRRGLKQLRQAGAGAICIFPDSDRYLNPNMVKAQDSWIIKLYLLWCGHTCLKATLENFSPREGRCMDGYAKQAARWSQSRRQVHWHLRRESAAAIINAVWQRKSRPLMKYVYIGLHRLLFEIFRLAALHRKLVAIENVGAVRIFVSRYLNRVGFVLNDCLVHAILEQHEDWICRPTLEIGIANGEAPQLMHQGRTLDAGLEFLPFWPIWGKARGNFKNFGDRIASGDAARLPFKPSVFNTIIMINVISHCMDLDRTIEELHRALRPGGRVILNHMTRQSWQYTYMLPTLARRLRARWLLKALEPLYDPKCRQKLINSKVNHKYHLKSERSWRRLFERKGFRVEKCFCYDADTFWVTRIFEYGLLEPMIDRGYKFGLQLPAERAAQLYAALADKELQNLKENRNQGHTRMFFLRKTLPQENCED